MSILGNAIMVGGSSPTPPAPTTTGWSDVNFIDYDGTLLYSYTTSEFQALTSMPANPTHSGLTSQGWNWSLADAKAYVAKYDKLNVGQMYITSDGKTRIYIHLEEGRLSPYCGFGVNGTAIIDWGDESNTNTVTGTSVSTAKNTQHTYSSPGDYVIEITVSSGTIQLFGDSSYRSYILRTGTSTSGNNNRVYQNAVQKIEIGSNVGIGSYAFAHCSSLENITIPNGVTSIGTYAFYSCYSLGNITIPDSVTSIETYAFYYCYGLNSITIPDSVTSIETYAFYYCYGLNSITIPDDVTSIGNNTFHYCYGLDSITIPDDVTSIGTSAFSNCFSLGNIIIPDGVTSIGTYAFYSCYSLGNITIPDGVTSIGNYTFTTCYGLNSITIPDSVTSIGTYAFQNCYGLGKVKFEPTTPPTVSNSNAWTNVPTDCVIYVPSGTLSAYTTATNYPSSSTYTYVEY